jgi:hypothetical protein
MIFFFNFNNKGFGLYGLLRSRTIELTNKRSKSPEFFNINLGSIYQILSYTKSYLDPNSQFLEFFSFGRGLSVIDIDLGSRYKDLGFNSKGLGNFPNIISIFPSFFNFFKNLI